MDHTYFALQKRVMTKCLIVILNDYGLTQLMGMGDMSPVKAHPLPERLAKS